MGCDCGKRVETPAEKAECEKSAELEAPDQVYEEKTFNNLITETIDSERMKKGKRIKNGKICESWGVVLLDILLGSSSSTSVVGFQIQIWKPQN